MIDQMEWPSHLCSLPVWNEYQNLSRANAVLYESDPRHNLSTDDHPTASEFGRYLTRWRMGRLLDVGCGPLPWPTYLRDHHPFHTHGIDPLADPAQRPFQKMRAMAEDIPYPDDHFATIVAATSLDHLLNIEVALKEVRRVLDPGGTFVVWVRYWPGSPIYDPFSTEPKPPDPHHLYHLDEWFERLCAAAKLRPVHHYQSITKPATFIAFQ